MTEQPDVDAAADFYCGLFGRTFDDVMPPGAPGGYLIARLNGADVGVLADSDGQAASWNTYVAVTDADAAARRCRRQALPRSPGRPTRGREPLAVPASAL